MQTAIGRKGGADAGRIGDAPCGGSARRGERGAGFGQRFVLRAGRANWKIHALAIVMLGATGGCQTAGKVVERGGTATRTVLGKVDPTGLIPETERRMQTWEQAQSVLREVDVEEWNRLTSNLATAVEKLSERLDALDPGEFKVMSANLVAASAALRKNAEAMDTTEILAALGRAAVQIERHVASLEVERLNRVLAQTEAVSERVKEVIVQAEPAIGKATEKTVAAVMDVRSTLAALPVQELRNSADRVNAAAAALAESTAWMPGLGRELNETVRSIRMAAYLAMGVMGLFGSCAVGWLLRQRAPRAAGG